MVAATKSAKSFGKGKLACKKFWEGVWGDPFSKGESPERMQRGPGPSNSADYQIPRTRCDSRNRTGCDAHSE